MPALQQLQRAHAGRLTLVAMDVCSEPSIAQAAKTIRNQTERVDLLVNCAGFLHQQSLQPEKRVEQVDPGYLERSFAVNASAIVLIAKHHHRLFPRQAPCMLASLSARVGSISDNRLGGWYGYRAAKAAHNMFIRTLAIELRRSHKQLVCVALHPGTTDTALSRPFQHNVPTEQLFSGQRAAQQLLQVMDGLDEADNGRFFAWDGKAIPW